MNTKKESFVAYYNNKKIRKLSSSGGVFYALAREVLQARGVVFGVSLNKDNILEYKGVFEENDLYSLMGSKYVFAKIGDTFEIVKKFLKAGRMVLFVGTPCIVAALKRVIGKNDEKLLVVDFVCHGCAKPQIWKNI